MGDGGQLSYSASYDSDSNQRVMSQLAIDPARHREPSKTFNRELVQFRHADAAVVLNDEVCARIIDIASSHSS